MASQPGQGPSKDVDPILIIAGAILLGVLWIIFWSAFHTNIATAYSWLRIVQFAPFVFLHSAWLGGAGALAALIGLTIFFAKKNGDPKFARWGLIAVIGGAFFVTAYLAGVVFESWFYFLKDSDKSLIEWRHLSKSSLYANLFTIVVVIIPFSVWIVRKSFATNPMNHKHFAKGKDYNLHTFTDEMGVYYPHLKLFRKIALTARSINKGKYRMADTEKQFVIKNNLLDRVKGNEFKVNRDRASEVFRAQMSPLWRGYLKLTRSEMAVIAVLIPRIAATDITMPDDEYKEALATTKNLLASYWSQAAATYEPESSGKTDFFKLDLTMSTKAVDRWKNSPKVKKIIASHAYVDTIIYAMLLESRSLGVLQPAEFRWLRVIDRSLWMVVDNVGRNVASSECSATYSHYLHEIRQKRAIEQPQIGPAVTGLINAVESFKFSDEEIEEINFKINSKLEKVIIDPTAVVKEKLNIILMAETIGDGPLRDIFEVAILAENGTVLYNQRCKSVSPITDVVREKYLLSNDDVDALSKLISSTELRAKVLEICNGHDVKTYDQRDYVLFPGLDRSAASLSQCRTEDSMDLISDAVIEGVIEEKNNAIRSALAAAQLCRLMWIAQRKAALKEQANRPKDA